MNVELAQGIAIACHANAALSGRLGGAMFPAHPTFRSCRDVTFVTVEADPLSGITVQHPVAESPDAWFATLREGRCMSVELVYEPSDTHPTGPESWCLVTNGREGDARVWQPRWTRSFPHADGGNPTWRVAYRHVVTRPARVPARADLVAVRDGLEDALTDTLRLLGRYHTDSALDVFVGRFRQALVALGQPVDSGAPVAFAPSGTLPAIALVLLRACERAMAPGPVGAWWTTVFCGEAQRERARVSDRMDAALHRAIVAATNASVRIASGVHTSSSRASHLALVSSRGGSRGDD